MSTQERSISAPFVPTLTIHDILCLTDLSPRSRSALEHARHLAERFQAELTVYHAVETFEGVYPDLTFGISQELSRGAEKFQRVCPRAAAKGIGVRCGRVHDPSGRCDIAEGHRTDRLIKPFHSQPRFLAFELTGLP